MSNKTEATFGGGCGAEHGCVRPVDNPPHICTQGWGHWVSGCCGHTDERHGWHGCRDCRCQLLVALPTTPHRDFSGFAWNSPETPHTWMVAP